MGLNLEIPPGLSAADLVLWVEKVASSTQSHSNLTAVVKGKCEYQGLQGQLTIVLATFIWLYADNINFHNSLVPLWSNLPHFLIG